MHGSGSIRTQILEWLALALVLGGLAPLVIARLASTSQRLDSVASLEPTRERLRTARALRGRSGRAAGPQLDQLLASAAAGVDPDASAPLAPWLQFVANARDRERRLP